MTHESPGAELAERIVAAGGGHVRAILLYGSQLLGARPGRHSAFDFVVLVDDYRGFYGALAESDELHRPIWLMTSLARVLAPNAIAFAPNGGHESVAKCQVVSSAHFERALGDQPPDHFLLGRLVQRVETVWARRPEDEAWVAGRLAHARAGVLAWMLPYLEEPVDAAGLGRRLLEVCYRGEFRPEAMDRAHKIFETQVDHFRDSFPRVLEAGVASGSLVREGERYRRSTPVAPADRRRWRAHFAKSKTRATLRWFKHMVTFANWLPYIVHKVERHTGKTIELTKLEQKLPIVFLWPRAIHVLLTRPDREIRS